MQITTQKRKGELLARPERAKRMREQAESNLYMSKRQQFDFSSKIDIRHELARISSRHGQSNTISNGGGQDLSWVKQNCQSSHDVPRT